ncbi:MAG: hypothetical protein ACO1PZ_15440 [Gammaproteobacteria bacterium]
MISLHSRMIVPFIGVLLAILVTSVVATKPSHPDTMDSNGDGKVSNTEWTAWQRLHVDTNGDGTVSRSEWNAEYLDSGASMETWRKRRYYHANVDRTGNISLEDWKTFHAVVPELYGGHDENGVIPWNHPDYYEREFRRVDCNHDAEIDWYEFRQLSWNARWCTSSLRPDRPWWR